MRFEKQKKVASMSKITRIRRCLMNTQKYKTKKLNQGKNNHLENLSF
jgi:hypothetical protein